MNRRSQLRSLVIALVCTIALPQGASHAAQADDGSASAKSVPETESKAPAPKQYDGPPTWYTQTRVSTEFGIVSTHYWSKGTLFRAQTMLAGHPVTTVVDATHYYVYDEILGRGAAIERNAKSIAEDEDRGRPFGREREDLLATGGELVREGETTDSGISFDVYQLTNENGRRRVIVTHSDPPLPVRVETFVRATGKRGVLEYSGWQRDLPVEDSFFVPPKTVKFERVTYAEYVERARREPVGPAPVYYRDLLHGKRPADR